MGCVGGLNPAGGIVLSPNSSSNLWKCSLVATGSRIPAGLESSSLSSSSFAVDRVPLLVRVSQSRCCSSFVSLWSSSAAQCSCSGRSSFSEQLSSISSSGLRGDFDVSQLSSHLSLAANSRRGLHHGQPRRRAFRVYAKGPNDSEPVYSSDTKVRSEVKFLLNDIVLNLVDPTEPRQRSKESLSTLVEPVADDLRILNDDLHSIVGAENPLLMAAAEQIFSAGGKRLRPALVFLVSKATAQLAGLEAIRPQHWRLAQVIEMIHTASLIHDDVLDESDTRRGKETIHTLFGTRVAVLAGDFMFAQSSWYLANLDNLEVIKLISQVIKDFASGEIKQAMSLFDCDISLQDYLDKSYYKTASLIAASTRSAAIFSGMSNSVCDQMYDYGLHLGLAFQVVDDILDFTQSSEQLGKPAGSDLAKGNLTAPVLFALQSEPELRELISSEFNDEGSLDAAIALVNRGGGIEKARQLAQDKGNLALKNLDCLPQSSFRHSLEGIVDYVLDRIY